MLKQPDERRQAELAALSKSATVIGQFVPVEVREQREDRWAIRMPPSEFVEDREPTEPLPQRC